MQELEHYIEAYFGIGGTKLSRIADMFEPKQLGKNDYYLKQNSYSKSLSFVKTGYLRMFAYDQNDEKEITQWISAPGGFVADLASYMFGSPSRWNIQALTDCELYTISKDQYDAIGRHVEDWAYLEKLFISKCFVSLENRVFSQLSMSSEERFNYFFDQNAAMFNEVPLQYIASMLGMSPETLSRIRNKKIS